jgi:hypothetical protein
MLFPKEKILRRCILAVISTKVFHTDAGLVSARVFQTVSKGVPNPTNLVFCITPNHTFRTFNAVPIPSGPGSGLLSTRVFQMVSKGVLNPSNHVSCIASTC